MHGSHWAFLPNMKDQKQDRAPAPDSFSKGRFRRDWSSWRAGVGHVGGCASPTQSRPGRGSAGSCTSAHSAPPSCCHSEEGAGEVWVSTGARAEPTRPTAKRLRGRTCSWNMHGHRCDFTTPHSRIKGWQLWDCGRGGRCGRASPMLAQLKLPSRALRPASCLQSEIPGAVSAHTPHRPSPTCGRPEGDSAQQVHVRVPAPHL